MMLFTVIVRRPFGWCRFDVCAVVVDVFKTIAATLRKYKLLAHSVYYIYRKYAIYYFNYFSKILKEYFLVYFASHFWCFQVS